MTYAELIKRLFAVNLHGGMKLGLKNCQRLQQLLHFPDRCYKTIHVAGTNGKGSVVIKIAAGLQAAGYRVGLYTSPHLSCFRERIRVNGEMISEQAIEGILPELFELVQKENIPATFFEITTFLAFLHFAREKVDIVVLETGLGGRLDATNIVQPLLSVITSISLDHTEFLGNTVEEIAKEKAGIIKPGVPVLIGPKVPLSTIRDIAEPLGSPYWQVTEESPTFDEENSLIAGRALELLAKPLSLTKGAIQEGIKARQPCRLEAFQGVCPIVLDVAHNPDGLEHLFQAIRRQFGQTSLRLLFGLSKNKDIRGCLAILKDFGSDFHVVEASNGRGAPIDLLKTEMERLGIPSNRIHLHTCITQGLHQAREEAEHKRQILIVCGSFFIMSAVRQALGLKEPRDSFDMNEQLNKNHNRILKSREK